MNSLSTPVSSLGGIFKRYVGFLEKLDILTLEDFLFHVPARYDDFSLISTISRLQLGEVVTIKGEVLEIKNQYTRRSFTIQRAKVKDETGIIDVVWFNQPYIPKSISPGDQVFLAGKIERKPAGLVMQSPVFEPEGSEQIHTGRIVPIYPETRGVSSKWIRRQVYKLLNENQGEISDFLPIDVIERNKLEDLFTSIRKIHFPDNLDEANSARERLSFNELFLLQASSLVRREEWNKNLSGFSFEVKKHSPKIEGLIKSLPFELTNAQKRTVEEIFIDVASGKPMNRLLEGDVGSGKTVVAAIVMYLSHLNSFQSVLMAPTEILAIQHYRTLSDLLNPLGIKVAIATSSKKESLKDFDVLVGTHAVISEKIDYKKLGFVVIDEQQRFGVEQRGILRKKGKNPHLLAMTATPIPRTIALTMYGDLDLSLLDEMPKGRKIIKTWLVPEEKRQGAYEWIKKQIKQNKIQAFVICPFIEESETMTTVKAAVKEYEHLEKDIFKEFKLGLLHGRIKSKEKEKILKDFKDKKFDILVATPVVEVGIDIPNADIILIEAAERFGLSQLHQLRGRVGRNDRQSYCLLFTDSTNPMTHQRLKAMEQTNIGAELAELDLKLRGPGEIYGTQQHGRKFLKIASFSDFDLIKKTKSEAEIVVKELDQFPKLAEKIAEINVAQVSPD